MSTAVDREIALKKALRSARAKADRYPSIRSLLEKRSTLLAKEQRILGRAKSAGNRSLTKSEIDELDAIDYEFRSVERNLRLEVDSGTASHASRRTAIHEAGHAVAGTMYFNPVEVVVLESEGGGYCRFRHTPSIQVTAAAFAAEKVFGYGHDLFRMERSSDWKFVHRFTSDVRLEVGRMYGFAARHRDAIEAVADALLARGRLTGREVREIIDAAPADPTRGYW